MNLIQIIFGLIGIGLLVAVFFTLKNFKFWYKSIFSSIMGKNLMDEYIEKSPKALVALQIPLVILSIGCFSIALGLSWEIFVPIFFLALFVNRALIYFFPQELKPFA